MALPVYHPLHEIALHAHSASVGASPIAAVMRSPCKGTIVKVGLVVEAAFTTDMSVAVAVIPSVAGGTAPGAGTAVTGSPFTVTASNSAAGTTGSTVPTAANTVNEDDTILFTPSGSTGANVPGTFFAVIRKG